MQQHINQTQEQLQGEKKTQPKHHHHHIEKMYSRSVCADYILSAYKYIILLYCFFVVVGRFNISNLKENARSLTVSLIVELI